MLRKKAVLSLMVFALLLSSALPAFAVSSITNRYHANDYSINTGQVITFKSESVYDNIGIGPIYNPYASDFYTIVNYDHFNKPSTFASSGLNSSNNWIYDNYDSRIGGGKGWYYNSGVFWIYTPQTKYLRFTATAKSASSGSRKTHAHGQNHWSVSYGGRANIYTTHN